MIKLTQDGHDIYLFGDWDEKTAPNGVQPKELSHNQQILLAVIKGEKLPFRVESTEAIRILRAELLSQMQFRNQVTTALRIVRDNLWKMGQDARADSPVAGDIGTSFATGRAEGMHVGIMMSSQSISDVLDAMAITVGGENACKNSK